MGLSDGETMERLWSYLRRYGKMTKEMRPSHRVDILTDALLYYGALSKKKLGLLNGSYRCILLVATVAAKLLLVRWERAKRSLQIAEAALQELMPSASNMDKTIRSWLEEEKQYSSSTPALSMITLSMIPTELAASVLEHPLY